MFFFSFRISHLIHLSQCFVQYNITVITMSSKTKITLHQNKYALQHLLRHYQQAIEITKSGEYLQPPDIFRMLDSMGYLCHQKTEKDYQLINSLTFMLAFPKGQGIVSQRNLFQFLVIINNLHGDVDHYFQSHVQPLPMDVAQLEQPLVQVELGQFDKNGVWRISKQQEKSVKQVFGTMIYTRVSRQDINTNKRKESEANSEFFKPKILNKSIHMAENRFKKLNMEEKVEDRLLRTRDLNNSKLQNQIKEKLQDQIKQCSFKPKINLHYPIKDNKQNYLPNQERLLLKGEEYRQRRRINQHCRQQYKTSLQLSQCSFKPNISSSSSSLRNSLKRQFNSTVKNKEKSIQRMKIAREERQTLNEFNKRGYPEGKSWVHFMEEVRTKRCNTSNHNNSYCSNLQQKPIIFTMDLKILGQQKHLQVKQADDILEMTHRICKNHNMNSQNYNKVYNIIQKTLRQSGQALIKNGKVFLFKKK